MRRSNYIVLLLLLLSATALAQPLEIGPHKGYIGTGVFVRNMSKTSSIRGICVSPEFECSIHKNIDIGAKFLLTMTTDKTDNSRYVGFQPFARFHAYILGNCLDPFVDLIMECGRFQGKSSQEEDIQIRIGISPGLRVPLGSDQLFLLFQMGFLGYAQRKDWLTDVRVGFLFFL